MRDDEERFDKSERDREVRKFVTVSLLILSLLLLLLLSSSLSSSPL